MKVTISDLGIINTASIEFGGLTVIAGENDTGKSTIGKLMFSLVKAVSKHKEDLAEDQESKIFEKVEHIFFALRKEINFSKHTEIRALFFPPTFIDHIRKQPEIAIEKRLQYLTDIDSNEDINEKSLEITKKNLLDIKKILEEPVDKITAINNSIAKIFNSEFKDEIIQKGNPNRKSARIHIQDGKNEIIDVEWTNDNQFKLAFYDDIGYSDATYVDSISVLQIHHLMDLAQTVNRGSSRLVFLPLHMTDLAFKLRNSVYNVHDSVLTLAKTYKGLFYFDKEKSEFMLDRGHYKISSHNIASGIKAMGILDTLIRSECANSRSLLVLDEPETNLHPKWQIEYAKLLCKLVQSGANIVVSTHSPYMIEALKGFAHKNAITHHVYLSQKQDGYAHFSDISDDISPAIDMLSKPLIELNSELFDDFE